jgi:hypothetical protein
MTRTVITSHSSRFTVHPRYSREANIEHQVMILIVDGSVELHIERQNYAKAEAVCERDVLVCETIEAACDILLWHPLINRSIYQYVLEDLKRWR